MSIIANRVKKGWGNWSEVIDRIPRFAATKEMPTGTPEIWDAGFVRLLHEVDAIYDGSKNYASFKTYDNRPVEGLYWCDSNRVDNPWFTEHVLGELSVHPKVGDMGTLLIFS